MSTHSLTRRTRATTKLPSRTRDAAPPRGVRRVRKQRSSSAARALYLGCFYFDEVGDPDQTGTFQIIVEADDPAQAVDRCRACLRRLRRATTLFNDPVTIQMEGIIRLTGPFQDGLLVNWETHGCPPPPDARITCLIPEPKDRAAQSFGLKPRKRTKTKYGMAEDYEPFLDFGGENARLAAERARHPVPAAPAGPDTKPPERTTGARKSETRRRTATEGQARRERRARLAATMDELRDSLADAVPATL